MFKLKTISSLIIFFFVLSGWNSLEAQVLVVGDSSMSRVDSLSYETDDVVVTATRVEKKIIDIENEELNNLSVPEELKGKYKIHSYRVQFEGLCNKCQISQ